MSIYVDNFFIASKYFNTINILKEMFSQKFNIKDLGEVQMIIQ